MDEEEMAKYPGLKPRDNGVWYVRKRVPVDLKHVYPNESERKSLETKDKREAIRRYPFKLAEIEAGFDRKRAELRERGTIAAALATAKLENLGRREIETLALDWWAKRQVQRTPGFADLQEQVAAVRSAEEDIDLQSRATDEGRDLAGEVADRLLVEAGIASGQHRAGAIKTTVKYPVVDRSTEAYASLRDLICSALQIEGRLALDHATGERTAALHPLFNPDPKMAGLPGGGRLTLSELISRYRVERDLRFGGESTDRKFGLLFRVLKEAWGPDLPLQQINRQRCIELVSFISRIPPNATKTYPRLTLAEAVKAAEAKGEEPLAPNTVTTYVNNLSAILNWAAEKGLIDEVNTKGLVRNRGPKVKRRGFEPHELRKLFDKLEEFRTTEPWKFWVPALALFTGARAGEICQLYVEDVTVVKDIHCLNLTLFDNEGRRVSDKKLKNEQSERFVPLHDELIRSGFLDFARSCKGQVRLFPELKLTSKGDYSGNMSKWFGRIMDRVDLMDPSLVFHSFRHGFRDACEDADITDRIADALGGWASITQGQKYGSRGRVPNLHRALKLIGFGDFRLTEVCPNLTRMNEESELDLQPVATVEP